MKQAVILAAGEGQRLRPFTVTKPKTMLSIAGKPISTNMVTFARPKHLELPDPQITTKIKTSSEGDFEITLTAKRPALWVWLELAGEDAIMTDNFFHLPPGVPKTIYISPVKPLTLAKVKQKLKIRSLLDTY